MIKNNKIRTLAVMTVLLTITVSGTGCTKNNSKDNTKVKEDINVGTTDQITDNPEEKMYLETKTTKVEHKVGKKVPDSDLVSVALKDGKYFTGEIKKGVLYYEGIEPTEENDINEIEILNSEIKDFKPEEFRDNEKSYDKEIDTDFSIRDIIVTYKDRDQKRIGSSFKVNINEEGQAIGTIISITKPLDVERPIQIEIRRAKEKIK